MSNCYEILSLSPSIRKSKRIKIREETDRLLDANEDPRYEPCKCLRATMWCNRNWKYSSVSLQRYCWEWLIQTIWCASSLHFRNESNCGWVDLFWCWWTQIVLWWCWFLRHFLYCCNLVWYCTIPNFWRCKCPYALVVVSLFVQASWESFTR